MKESTVYNMDCMEYMRSLPDKAFDLAIVDPPYGDGLAGGGWNRFGQRFDRYKHQTVCVPPDGTAITRGGGGTDKERMSENQTEHGVTRTGGTWAGKYAKKIITWDVAPEKEYFEELFRVSRNQIIWGGNYFSLPPTRCFLVWRKLSISENFSMAMAEYAWTSFNGNAKVFEYAPQGKVGDQRFHPTQKPVALYKWILNRYAAPGDKILDTHLGSGSSRIAAWDMGFDFVGCEIDKVYFDLEEKRFAEHTAQTRMDLT